MILFSKLNGRRRWEATNYTVFEIGDDSKCPFIEIINSGSLTSAGELVFQIILLISYKHCIVNVGIKIEILTKYLTITDIYWLFSIQLQISNRTSSTSKWLFKFFFVPGNVEILLKAHFKRLFESCGAMVCNVYWQFELLLQDGIEPMWEDERNKRGGRWLITLTKQQRRLDLDRFWLETVGFVCGCWSFILLRVVTHTSDKINHFLDVFPNVVSLLPTSSRN